MVQFTATILKFAKKAEKTGWTYIEIPADIAQRLKPGNKKSFRVKGKLDNWSFKGIALMPMGDGNFIMPLNAGVRKNIGKKHGAMLQVRVEEDKAPLRVNPSLMECLADEPEALSYFKQLPPSHRNYFSKWIDSAKTEPTRAKRIAQSINALSKKQNFAQMLRAGRK